MKSALYLFDQRGAITLKGLFWVVVIVVAVYGGYKLVPPSVSYYMLKTEVEEEAKIAHRYSDAALAGRIINKARTWDIPIERRDIVISRGFRDLTIDVAYSVEIRFVGGYTRTNEYYIHVSEPIKEGGNVLR